MDGTAAINTNLEALKRILIGLIAMAGLAPHLRLVLSPQAGASFRDMAFAEKSKLPQALTLRRHLYLAVLRLLRPAESAARRLVIAAARGIVVNLPEATPREPEPHQLYVRSVITMHSGVRVRMLWQPGAQFPKIIPLPPRPSLTRLSFPLLDPPHDPLRRRRPVVSGCGLPRIGWNERLPQPPPSRDDPVDATRLNLRLAALDRVLADLPAQARRFARWKAVQGRACQRRNTFRLSPLRRGRPPGGRLSRYDPAARRGHNIREIDEILAHCHALADYALSYPDTS
jgi:hypothetical protein